MYVSFGVDVVQHEVALRERAALHVLAGEANRDAFDEQRRVRERLGVAPLDPAVDDRIAASLELLRELRVNGESVGRAQQLLVQLDQHVRRRRR